MKRIFTTFLLSTIVAVAIIAQSKFTVKGVIIENGTQETIPTATVQVLSTKDSSLVAGAVSGLDGTFNINSVAKGKYIIKVSFIGYTPHSMPLDLTSQKQKTVDVGYITLTSDAVMLKEATVTAKAAQVQVSGDSIVYNASAYRVAEGSALEELVKKLPGAQVDDEGNITINGKTVKKILVDGKEFFLNDTKVAMKNIPTNMIDRLKTYDRKSDLARITGIDDGEEETVLDLTVKKGMNNGWFGNIDAGIGTDSRYSERLMLNRFIDHNQFTIIGGANNTGDRGFGGGGGRGGWGRGGNGLMNSKDFGFNFATESAKLELGGNFRYRYNGSDVQTLSNTQNFVSPTGAFSRSNSLSRSSGNNFNANFRLEWKPDSMTNIIFRPSGSLSNSKGFGASTSATFNDNPANYSDEPLNEIERLISNFDNLVVNYNARRNQSYSSNRSINGELQINRRLSDTGRNITFRATGGASGSDSKQLSASKVEYFNTEKPVDINNLYYNTPGRNSNYSLQLTYSEPIAYRTYLQLSYRYNYSYSKNDRQAYTYDDEAYSTLYNSLMVNRYDIDAVLRYMDGLAQRESIYEKIFDTDLSKFTQYRNYNQYISLSFRKIGEKYNFNAGIEALPQRSKLTYRYLSVDTALVRNVFNVTPAIDFRYQFSKTSQLRFNYRGRTSQPSMTSMLPITDPTDPLNITVGNPGLKPSFSNDIMMFFNTFDMEHQRSIFTFARLGLVQNSISNRTSYDASTGVRKTTTENVNGNWNTNLGVGFNTALDANKYFTSNTNVNFNYSHNVSLLDPNQYAMDRSKTNTMGLGGRQSFGYRNNWFEVSINGNVMYNHSRNNVLTTSNLDTWTFSYGTEFNFTLPWGTQVATDISESSRRGFSQASMNTNELLWNAQISHSFLKGNALTVSFQWNDILHNQSNISRNITAMMSSDSRYNAIYSYGMLHVIYKLNIFGGKNSNGTDKERGFGFPGGYPGAGGPRGGAGGMGGARPMGGGTRGGFGGPR